ncbi:Translin-1 [Asimina triloba]
MASAAGATGWLRGRVKAVPSGDCLVIMGSTKAEIPPEKSITLSSLIAPRLARRAGVDEPFAWESREYLRKKCIGKEVTFKVDYTVPSIGREFGSVFLGDENVAMLVVSEGWAKVREQGQQKGEVSPFLSELQRLEEQARVQGLGRWTKAPGASEASIRNLPPSAIGDPSNFDAMALLSANKGRLLEGIVEQVRDGSTVRVYLLPDFQFVQVFIAGIQSPSMGRRAIVDTVVETEVTSEETNGEAPTETQAPLTSAQRVAASTTTEVSPDAFGREAKHFTEIRVLNRDVRIVLEGVDKFSNLIGSVYYEDGDSPKDLALELVESGLAKFVEWSANMMEEDAKRKLKAAELQAKKERLRMWTNYIPPATNSKAIHDQNFSGKVVEVVSGDCVIVADDSIPFGSPAAERRVNLSSIRAPKMGNPRRDEKPAPYAREAREFLRQRLIGQQVNVSMEYSRKVGLVDGPSPVPTAGSADSRVMDFGSVFLASSSKDDGDDAAPAPTSAGGPAGINVAELVVARGFGTVIRHRDFEERSNYYDALLAAESRAINGKKGMHSAKDPPVMHITDLLTASAKKAKDFLPFLQRKRLPAVVEYVLSGHRFKLLIPKETCNVAFSFSGVRCPGRDEPFSDEAIAFMRRKILQRDVEIEVETVDRTGTFLGSLWESKTNMAVPLLEAGLAKFQTAFGADRIADAQLLARAEQSAKNQRLKVWENYVDGQEATNGSSAAESKQKEVLKVVVTEVLSGGKFYVQTVGDQKVASIQKQLASLNLQDAPVMGAFNPKKGDIVLAQFSADKSWNRAMIVNAPRFLESPKDKFEVFYIDYGNQETVPYTCLRPLDSSVSSALGLAQLCSLAYIKVPNLEEDFGQEAAEYLSECILDNSRELRAMIEERDTSGGKVKGQGTGTVLVVTLVDVEAGSSVNAAMLKVRKAADTIQGLARLERKKRWDTKERQLALDNLEEHQAAAKRERLNLWQYGDIQSDDEEDSGPPSRRAGGRRGHVNHPVRIYERVPLQVNRTGSRKGSTLGEPGSTSAINSTSKPSKTFFFVDE